MKLSQIQQSMLEGHYGSPAKKALQLLIQLGDIYQAPQLIPVYSTHISGVSYQTIGDPGLEYIQDLADSGAKVRAFSLLNPAGMDLQRFQEMGVPQAFAAKQMAIIEAFEKIGVIISPTCTPYLAGYTPSRDEHVAWSESSAVSFINSYVGARTNREAGPSAIASALTGFTPYHGLHLVEKRRPDVLIQVGCQLFSEADYGALGYFVGKKIGGQIPYFKGIGRANPEQLKLLGAAMAASGAVALYYIEGVTLPKVVPDPNLPVVIVGEADLQSVYQELTSTNQPEFFYVGCPHASLFEIFEISELLKGKTLKKPFWICTSRTVRNIALQKGLSDVIEQAGARIFVDTCMVVAPLELMGVRSVGTNSAKAAHYLKNRGILVWLSRLGHLIEYCL